MKGSKMEKGAMLSFPIALALVAGSAFAADKMDGMKEMGKPSTASARTHKAVGVVRALDAKTGSVTFDHEAVKSLNWPAMRMAFAVKDKMLFDKLAAGKKVEFEFVQDGKSHVVTSVK
jgi:Cu(I)/Ag(I) efflux system protein CusF